MARGALSFGPRLGSGAGGRIRVGRPWLVVPPCAWRSTLLALHVPIVSAKDVERREAEAHLVPSVARDIYRHQLKADLHFLCGRPAWGSWLE